MKVEKIYSFNKKQLGWGIYKNNKLVSKVRLKKKYAIEDLKDYNRMIGEGYQDAEIIQKMLK